MALMAGSRLGPYEIIAPLGAGGMGEVYRALDTDLGRQVAIKILPDAFAQDPERLARFEREAKTLAALNHSHIAAIYGLERSDGQTALVMELVEGPTLADRIAEGRIPVDEALAIAKQIAEALEAAHEQGIIHRDLKPANIKVRFDGMVKVLDFGLAKAFDPTASSSLGLTQSPTLSLQGTYTGLILGTAAYMSPEQAAAKAVDKRADIWSFGVVVWEMLTAKPLFAGETISHTLADVLRTPIDFDQLPANMPSAIRQLLRRCLDRDVKRRLRDIGEARIMIERAASPSEGGVAIGHDGVGPAKAGNYLRALPWAVAVTAVLAAVTVLVLIQRAAYFGRAMSQVATSCSCTRERSSRRRSIRLALKSPDHPSPFWKVLPLVRAGLEGTARLKLLYRRPAPLPTYRVKVLPAFLST
jgi:serine/threonine protein kinase